jgi:hypothetical protein
VLFEDEDENDEEEEEFEIGRRGETAERRMRSAECGMKNRSALDFGSF